MRRYVVNTYSQDSFLRTANRRLNNPLVRSDIISSTIAKIGRIATKAEAALAREVKIAVPATLSNFAYSSVDKIQELKRIITRSNEILASAKTVWPFTLFRDDIIVDRTKITITKRSFFFVSEIMSIRVEDILNVKVSLGPFFGSLTLAVRVLSSEDHHTINFFWREDAVHLKHIIQGYIIAQHNNIDCRDQNREMLIATLSELGHDSRK